MTNDYIGEIKPLAPTHDSELCAICGVELEFDEDTVCNDCIEENNDE